METQKTKILILGFGGTIAMVPDSDGVLYPAKSIDEILTIVPSLKEMADITVKQLINLDSTNLNPDHWMMLIDAILKYEKKYDGIIVTHGTDTMAYTASAVSLALGKSFQKPIVFTGSQLPLISHGTDAQFNLQNSLKVVLEAIKQDISEIMIVFSDYILRGNRAIKTSESKFTAFDSPAFPHLGSITAVGVYFNPLAFKKNPDAQIHVRKDFAKGVLAIELYPGIQPEIIIPSIKSGLCKGLILKSLGAGNVPSEGIYSILPLIRFATEEMNIPVLVSTKFTGGNTHMEIYEPGKLALDAGAIPTGDLTDVAAQVKCMWALNTWNKSKEEFKKIMNEDVAGEKG
jgi:L-asparaginase